MDAATEAGTDSVSDTPADAAQAQNDAVQTQDAATGSTPDVAEGVADDTTAGGDAEPREGETPTDAVESPEDVVVEVPDVGTVGDTTGIPVPNKGKLHAVNNTGETCAWALDGQPKGSSAVLDLTLFVGDYQVSCKRADGTTAADTVSIVAGQTTDVTVTFPVPNGTLVALAVGGTCTFLVNGANKGTSTQIELSVPPGVYTVVCKPETGASITRSVIIKSGESALALFKLNP